MPVLKNLLKKTIQNANTKHIKKRKKLKETHTRNTHVFLFFQNQVVSVDEPGQGSAQQ